MWFNVNKTIGGVAEVLAYGTAVLVKRSTDFSFYTHLAYGSASSVRGY